MDKFIYWMKKLGILRTGVYTAKGDAKKMVDMEIKSELYQSDKEIEKEMKDKKAAKKEKKSVSKDDQKTEDPRKNNSAIGKIIFWILAVIGLFFLLAFWGAGWSFWTIIGLLMWGFFLRWIWIHVASGLLALGKIIFLAAVVIFLSLIFATPKEEGMGASVKVEKSDKTSSEKQNSSSDLAKGVEKDTVAELLLYLKKDTKLDFSEIEDDEIVWPAERIKLQLQKAKSFKAEDLSAKEFDKLQEYFIDLGADSGGIGYTFTPPAGTQSAGFVLKGKENIGMMCVLMGLEDEGVWIGCGWGPTSNPNSK